MRCPYCNCEEDRVVDSRSCREGMAIRRRRECINCTKRFTTYEYIENVPLSIIKSDGRHEPFDRVKLLSQQYLRMKSVGWWQGSARGGFCNGENR